MQHESHELSDVGRIEMRQVTAFVPAQESLLLRRAVGWVMPLALAFDQLPQAGIVRWSWLVPRWLPWLPRHKRQ